LEQILRLQNVWSWLPAFRTVAETQHLPSAARALHVTPSALSRSIKHLEDAIGQSLFTREERRIKLNRNGEILLSVVRDAMHRIGDGIEQVSASAVERVRVAGPPTRLQLVVLPVVHQRRQAGEPLVVDVADVRAELVVPALLRGDLDLALNEVHVTAGELIAEDVGEVVRMVCCGRRPSGRPEVPFAVYMDSTDPWPSQLPRDVALWSPHLCMVVEECVSGQMQAVLPAAVARFFGLAMINEPALPSSHLYLTRRRPLRPTALDGLVTDLAAQARTVLDAHRSTSTSARQAS
jgi:DNA-binding transcriptional LysR family regulator